MILLLTILNKKSLKGDLGLEKYPKSKNLIVNHLKGKDQLIFMSQTNIQL